MSTAVKVSAIVAMATNRVIGSNNQLPWYLPNDLKYFKTVTMGKPIIMGRKTYDSIGKPLPGRANIVVTRNLNYRNDAVKVVYSLEQALTVAQSVAELDGASEVMVIGGAELYQLALPQLDRLYLTRVWADVDGDAFFPELTLSDWRELAREDFKAEGSNPYDYSFIVYERD